MTMNQHDNYPEASRTEDAQVFADDFALAAYRAEGNESAPAFQHAWNAAFEYATEDTNDKPKYPERCLLCSVGLCLTHNVVTP